MVETDSRKVVFSTTTDPLRNNRHLRSVDLGAQIVTDHRMLEPKPPVKPPKGAFVPKSGGTIVAFSRRLAPFDYRAYCD